MKRFAIIGAGIAGLMIARDLQRLGNVTVFEKSRGLGGRLSTRYANPFEFDHGVQFFTAKSEPFRVFLKPLEATGIISRWDAQFVELDRDQVIKRKFWDQESAHYVATPKMNQLGKTLAQGLDIRQQTLVTRLHKTDRCWSLFGEGNKPLGDFDWVIAAIPAAQAAQILANNFKNFERLNSTKMLGCHALMIGMKNPLDLDWQAARVKHSTISWISVNSSKPGRPNAYSIVAHTANDWSQDHIEKDKETIISLLLPELSQILNADLSDADHVSIHRWRYANIDRQIGDPALIDPEAKLAACGDWCIRGRVEAAFTSAKYLSEQLDHILQ